MKKAIAVAVAIFSMSAFADPIAIQVKSGTLVDQDDQTVQVDPGLYVNNDAWKLLRDNEKALTDQNTSLISKLESANQKILDCTPFIAGLPAWAYTVISVGLSILTAVSGYFVVKEATK